MQKDGRQVRKLKFVIKQLHNIEDNEEKDDEKNDQDDNQDVDSNPVFEKLYQSLSNNILRIKFILEQFLFSKSATSHTADASETSEDSTNQIYQEYKLQVLKFQKDFESLKNFAIKDHHQPFSLPASSAFYSPVNILRQKQKVALLKLKLDRYLKMFITGTYQKERIDNRNSQQENEEEKEEIDNFLSDEQHEQILEQIIENIISFKGVCQNCQLSEKENENEKEKKVDSSYTSWSSTLLFPIILLLIFLTTIF